MKRVHGVAIVMLAVGSAPALTAQPGGRGDPDAVWKVLARYDKNGDGQVSREEYTRGADKFAAFDRDGDGVLTRADLEQAPGRRRGQRGPRGGAQREDPVLALVRAADTDADGAVTAQEWDALLACVVVDGELDRDKLGDAMGRRMRARLVFRALDSDKDGSVTRADLVAGWKRVDRDADGRLSKQELPPVGRTRRPAARLPQVGERAPDFALPLTVASRERTRGAKTVTLASYAGKKPVALIFGSYT